MPDKIPESDHVTRYVKKRNLRRDEFDNVIGILHQALEHREDETYLSVTWVEHFDVEYETGFLKAAEAISRQLTVKKKDGFSTAQVQQFFNLCAQKGAKVRILHEADNDNNTGHAAIRRLPREDIELLDLLAAEAFLDTRVAEDIINF